MLQNAQGNWSGLKMGDGTRRDGKNKRLFVTSKGNKSFDMLTAAKYFHPSSNIEIDPGILE